MKTDHRKNQNSWQPQTVISLCSALIALCALTLSVYQGYLQRHFWKLSAKPHMTLSLFYNDDGAGFMFGGTGIGYSIMKTFKVFVDGKSQRNWVEMCKALGFAAAPAFDFTTPLPATVFQPDSYHKIFWIPSGPYAEQLKLGAGRILIKTCYCSVFEDCWTINSHTPVEVAVNKCPATPTVFSSPSYPVVPQP